MTEQQLKEILDKGGTLANGNRTLCKKEGQYYFDDGDGNSGTWSKTFVEYALLTSNWTELKPEQPEPPQFAPRMMVIDVREWNAMQRELEELRGQRQNKSFIEEAISAIKSKVNDISEDNGIEPIFRRKNPRPSWFPKDQGELEDFCASYASWWEETRRSSVQPDGWDWFEEFLKRFEK